MPSAIRLTGNATGRGEENFPQIFFLAKRSLGIVVKVFEFRGSLANTGLISSEQVCIPTLELNATLAWRTQLLQKHFLSLANREWPYCAATTFQDAKKQNILLKASFVQRQKTDFFQRSGESESVVGDIWPSEMNSWAQDFLRPHCQVMSPSHTL